MNLKLELIKSLLIYVDSYDNQSDILDMKAFTLYLQEQIFNVEKSRNPKEFDKSDYLNYKEYKEIEFSVLLTGLFRFAKHYLKKTFQNTSFKTIDEYGFLANLMREDSMLKNELISQHQLEMSTGSEVLKRLIKNGLIEEFPDKNDRRARRVKITQYGRSEILSAFDDMYKVSKVIKGNISDDELSQLLVILNKLTYFHKDIWAYDKSSDMNEIFTKYIKV
jgi:DNA-binding MarR family transcriptional regulator